MQPPGAAGSCCCLTPIRVTAPAWPLCSATGSAVGLTVGGSAGLRPAAYFRMARIRQSGPALSLVVHSTSPAPAARRARVAGGGDNSLLALRVRSSKRRRHAAYSASCRRRTRAGSRRVSFACESGSARPARTPRCPKSLRSLTLRCQTPLLSDCQFTWRPPPRFHDDRRILSHAYHSDIGVP